MNAIISTSELFSGNTLVLWFRVGASDSNTQAKFDSRPGFEIHV